MNIRELLRLNPLKRVNSILTIASVPLTRKVRHESQSPQTGQFNSYGDMSGRGGYCWKWSQSPQTGQFNSYLKK